MAIVKLNLKQLSVPDKVQFSMQVATAVQKNASLFPSPDPTVEDIQGASQTLADAYNDANVTRQLSYTKTAIQYQKEAELDSILTALGNYVNNTSKGDETIIKSAGLSTKAKSVPVGIPVQVLNLTAVSTVTQGQIVLKWKSVRGARSYIVRQTTDISDATKWTQDLVVTKTTATVNNLKSGSQYWFQIAAVGAAGQGPWSDPATKIVG